MGGCKIKKKKNLPRNAGKIRSPSHSETAELIKSALYRENKISDTTPHSYLQKGEKLLCISETYDFVV